MQSKTIKFFQDIDKTSVNIAGGKGASLGEMSGAGIPVPPGFVILASTFQKFIEETGVDLEIKNQLAQVNFEDVNSVDKASNVLRDIIHDIQVPDDLSREILAAFGKLGAELVAVRSSATAEDSDIASWAGELETYLNTTQENLLENIKKCWSSLFTPRAIFYRHEKDLIDAQVSVAVVVQTMIQSEVAGVAFTVHPVLEDPNQMIIEAGLGLGEAVVSGSITPDSYVLAKDKMEILDINIASQSKKLVIKKEGLRGLEKALEGDKMNEWVDLGEDEGGEQKLTNDQIIELAKLCKKIEDHYGFPCDIEWALFQNKFFITQSRPITTLKK